MLTNSNQQGITLIEILLTVALMGLVGMALVQLGSTSLTASDAGRQRAVATQLADEAIEAARAFRDGNSAEFFAIDDTNHDGSWYAYTENGDGVIDQNDFIDVAPNCNSASFAAHTDCKVGTTDFYRVVEFDHDDPATPTKADVTTYVFWNQQGTWARVVSSTVLTQWR